ncbi:hypothetical protein K7432_003683 [Basidiobolus ranarum]
MIASANQRKVFTIVTGKLFSPLLQVLDITQDRTEAKYLELYNNITTLLRFSLFHLDYIMDYSTILPYEPSKSSEKAARGIQSYQKQLFDQIHTLIKNQPTSDILYVYRSFPALFSYFIENCRRKQKSLTSAGSSSKDSSNLTEVVRTMEFAFFLEFYKVVEKSFLNSVQSGKSLVAEGTGEIQEVLNSLLNLLLKHNVYHLTNDAISIQQYEMLQRSMENFFQMYRTQPESGVLQTGLFKSCDTLLQLDNRIIEKHLEDIWKLALNPLSDSFKNCEEFIKNLMITYAKSRQFDSYVTGLFNALREIEDVNCILDQPIFSNVLLEEFTNSVATLPNAQHQEILSLFASELAEHLTFPGESAPTKKRKTGEESSKTIDSVKSAEPLGILMSRFLKGVKSDNMTKKKLDPGFTRIFQDFVEPVLQALKNASKSSNAFLRNYVYPALFLHQSICDVSLTYWTEYSSTEWILDAADLLEPHGKKEPRVQLFLCVLLLQHVERLASTPGDLTGSELTTICEGLVTRAINLSSLESVQLSRTWDGSLTHLTNDNLPVAYYKRIVGDCFEIVGRYSSKDQLRKLLTILIKSYISVESEPNNSGFAFRNITVKLLNNAQFFELIPVKENFLKVFLDVLQHKFQQDSCQQLVGIVANGKDAQIVEKVTAILSKRSVSTTSSLHTSEYIRLIEMLNLFPCEYFDRHDRDKIIVASLCIDKLFTSTDSLDSKLIHGPLTTRVLIEKLLTFHIDGSIILQDFQLLNYLLSTVSFSKQSKAVSEGVKNTTSTIQNLCLTRMFTLLTNKETAEKSVAYLQDAVNGMSQTMMNVGVSENVEALHSYNFVTCYTEYIESHYVKNIQTNVPLETIQFLHKFTLQLEDTIYPPLVKLKSELDRLTSTQATFNDLAKPIVNAEYLIYLFWALLKYQRIAIVIGNEQTKKLVTLISIIKSFSLIVNRMLADQEAADSAIYTQFFHVATHFLAGFCEIVFDLEPDMSSDTISSVTTLLITLKEVTNEKDVSQTLTDSFTKLIAKSPREYTAKLLEAYLDKIDILCTAPEQKSTKQTTHRVNEPAVLLNTINSIFTSVDHSQKRYFKRYIPHLVGKLILLLQCTSSVELILEALTLLKNMCSDVTLDYRTSDLVGVLDCLNQLGSPTLINRLREPLDETKANQIFDGIYHVLLSLVKSRREQLSEIFPNLTGVLGPLFYCFVTEHQTVSRRQQSKSQNNYGKTKPFSVITTFAPLSDLTAQNFARLITTLCTRPTNQAGKPSTSTFLKAFGKHAPYLIAEYLSIQTNPTASISKLSVRNAIVPGLYALLDLCGEHERDMVMVTLDLTGKSLFKSLYSDYLQYHKYTGKA